MCNNWMTLLGSFHEGEGHESGSVLVRGFILTLGTCFVGVFITSVKCFRNILILGFVRGSIFLVIHMYAPSILFWTPFYVGKSLSYIVFSIVNLSRPFVDYLNSVRRGLSHRLRLQALC